MCDEANAIHETAIPEYLIQEITLKKTQLEFNFGPQTRGVYTMKEMKLNISIAFNWFGRLHRSEIIFQSFTGFASVRRIHSQNTDW